MSRLPRCTPLLSAFVLGLLVGCHSFKIPGVGSEEKVEKPEKEAALGRPGKYSFRVSQYVFYSDFEIKRDQPIFRELSDLRDQLYKELQLPPPAGDMLIHVYLFPERDSYERFLQANYPKLPNRRAFFMEDAPHGFGKGDLLVFTFRSDRIKLDLRHELTHALLHSVLKDVPLWLDEGLAEYYELPPRWNGLNLTHVRMMRKEEIHPNLARLEKLSDLTKMNAPEYREAWAWVYLMLRGNPKAKEVLLAYLQELRTKSEPGKLQPRLAAVVPDLDAALDRLLAQLDDDYQGSER